MRDRPRRRGGARRLHAVMCPMSHHVIEASAHSAASRDAVWALVRDITTWQDWGTWSATTIETPAPGDDPQGVGVCAGCARRPVTSIERVTELVPSERLGYELVPACRSRTTGASQPHRRRRRRHRHHLARRVRRQGAWCAATSRASCSSASTPTSCSGSRAEPSRRHRLRGHDHRRPQRRDRRAHRPLLRHRRRHRGRAEVAGLAQGRRGAVQGRRGPRRAGETKSDAKVKTSRRTALQLYRADAGSSGSRRRAT